MLSCETSQIRRRTCPDQASPVGIGSMPIGASALALLFTLVVACGSANAEVGAPTPTVQAVAADATWLAYTPPPEHPGIVCMVDSGVDPNPDTEAAVIGGQAIAPETDTLDEIAQLEPHVQPGNHPDGHGTLMAMMMAAPINGWGMVGIAPTSVRVYNMKAMPKGEVTFPFAYYAIATADCQELQKSSEPTITGINLSLGGSQFVAGSELSIFDNNVTAAKQKGINIVAAAGNEGGPVLYPAAYPPILAVGAGDAGSRSGALCTFASHGEGLDIIAPGCDSKIGGLESAFEDDGSPALGSGSSQASAIVSAVLASMRAYNPQLTAMGAEECLTSTAKSLSIDVAAAFDACGLSRVVSEGEAAEQAAVAHTQSRSTPVISVNTCDLTAGCANASSPLSTRSSEPDTSSFEATAKCATPKAAHVLSLDEHLILQVHGRPVGCRLQARLLIRHGHQTQWRLTRGVLSTRLELPDRDPLRLEARYVSKHQGSASQWVEVKPQEDWP